MTYETHRYGANDPRGTVVYSGSSLLVAARVAARGKGHHQVVRPENYDEDYGLTSREQDIVNTVEWLEARKKTWRKVQAIEAAIKRGGRNVLDSVGGSVGSGVVDCVSVCEGGP